VDRVLVSEAKGRAFDPHRVHLIQYQALVAQWIEQPPSKWLAAGSSPAKRDFLNFKFCEMKKLFWYILNSY
jgi:hypothetical protein